VTSLVSQKTTKNKPTTKRRKKTRDRLTENVAAIPNFPAI